jgi:hypothetical protein
MSFISGAYTATYNATTLGRIQAGFNVIHSVNKQLVTGDNEGRAPQDAVMRGHNCLITFTLMEVEVNSAIKLAYWPWSATFGNYGTVGRTDVGSSLAKQLILTAVAGTPAATSPATLTAPLAICAEDQPIRVSFAPELRAVTLTMRLYPSSGNFFTT